ncbi:uncharacterized protein FIBRA_04616 [Fibroporia radiculosa]|uniref:Uncharacterized protein n=1 Tax=Fibroporia radiculosa TaxID=599839 RepID=J4H321_9APHY|nr:uncharacterized protein FIBRA_04616 [Fibroporia radiculosa]CCM02514.1 predicted protein [Fibroporia radiculosa]
MACRHAGSHTDTSVSKCPMRKMQPVIETTISEIYKEEIKYADGRLTRGVKAFDVATLFKPRHP